MPNLIVNPLTSPYFAPVCYLIAGLLGSTLLLLLVASGFRLDRFGENVLFQRWRTWVVIAPSYALTILGGQLPLLLLLTFIVFQSLDEYSQLVTLPTTYRWVLLGSGMLAAPIALLSLTTFLFLPPILLLVATLQPLIFQGESHGIRHLAFAALGWAYIAWFLACLMLLDRYVDGGPGILLAIGLGTALSDVGAFTVGKLFGRRKLAPRISPNKTWEGIIGNVLGAYLGVGLLAFALPVGFSSPLRLALPLVIAVGAVWGDLFESAIKREFQAKDAGSLLPGFGGLLDRIDSLLVVGPLAFFLVRLAA